MASAFRRKERAVVPPWDAPRPEANFLDVIEASRRRPPSRHGCVRYAVRGEAGLPRARSPSRNASLTTSSFSEQSRRAIIFFSIAATSSSSVSVSQTSRCVQVDIMMLYS